MIEVKTKMRKWGNSFGVVVPLKAVEHEKIKEGEEVIILLNKEKKNVLRETFGTLKSKKSAEQIMKEINDELDIGF